MLGNGLCTCFLGAWRTSHRAGSGTLEKQKSRRKPGVTLRWTNTVQVRVQMRTLRGQAGEVHHRGALGQKGKAVRAPTRRGLTAA